MKNTQYIVLIIIIFSSSTLYSQHKAIGVNWTKSNVDKDFDTTKIFSKETGLKISQKEFGVLIQQNPNLFLEREIDEAGNVIRYLYDSNNPTSKNNRPANSDASAMEAFPNFNLTTLDGTKIELSKLNGKLIILRFELVATGFRFKKQEIQELNEKINMLENKMQSQLLSYFNVPKVMCEKVLTSRIRILNWWPTDKILLTNTLYPVFHQPC